MSAEWLAASQVKVEELEREKEAQIRVDKQERDRQAFELACCPIPLSRIRSERHVARYPLFATSEECVAIDYKTPDGKRFIQTQAHPKYGMITEEDADVLRVAFTKAGEATLISNGGISPTVAFTRYELLDRLGWGDSKRSYERLDRAVLRLSHNTYDTNIFSKDSKRVHHGSLITSETLRNAAGEIEGVAFHFAPDVAASLANRGLLEVSPLVIEAQGSLKKKLIQIIDVSMGNEDKWEIGLGELARNCVFRKETWRFKEAIKRAKLPYKVAFRKGRADQVVTFERIAAPA